jgi:transposase
LKHDLQVLPMNVKKEATMRGFIFVTFISLILRMKLLKQMKDTDLLEEYTLDGLLLELAKIKKIRLANGEVITIEVSKKQRTILQALGLCA